MATYPNFYENLTEALNRLRNTIVLYNGEPRHIWTITDHKPDGKFRVYMSPIEDVGSMNISPLNQVPGGHAQMGPLMDTFMETNPNLNIERKMIDAPAFNRFRPFPLGMCNFGDSAYYIERLPARPKMEQGLKSDMLSFHMITAAANAPVRSFVEVRSPQFRDCILGQYPTPKEVLEGLKSDKYANSSVAFNRCFALVKGPIGSLFLVYKQDVIGILPNEDFSVVKLARQFTHLKEVTEELNLFPQIGVK